MYSKIQRTAIDCKQNLLPHYYNKWPISYFAGLLDNICLYFDFFLVSRVCDRTPQLPFKKIEIANLPINDLNYLNFWLSQLEIWQLSTQYTTLRKYWHQGCDILINIEKFPKKC